jgi:hypothetical protein
MDRRRLFVSAQGRYRGFGIAAAPLLGAVFAILPASSPAQIAPVTIDMAAMQPGLAPADFTFWRTGGGEVGEWRVVTDPTAIAQKAIAQTSKDKTDYRFPLAVYRPVSAKNVDVVVRFKPVGGKVDQAGGIAVRLTTPDDYYVARANALENNVRFYRVVKGRREQIEGANTKVASNEWHTLELRGEGERFTVSFDGKQLFTAKDNAFANGGKVALWTKADSVTYFDTVSITPLP